MTYSFIALDVETANSFRGSLCSIGLVKFIDGQEVDSFYTLINPEEKFSSRNIKIHAIKPEDVIGAPTFPEVQKEIINFIDNLPIVAHNARFDAYALQDVYLKYEIPFDNIQYFCSYQVCKIILTDLPNHKLHTLAKHFKISLDHHNALSDARACGLILLEILKLSKQTSIRKMLKNLGYPELGLIGKHGFVKNKSTYIADSGVSNLKNDDKKDNKNNISNNNEIPQTKIFDAKTKAKNIKFHYVNKWIYIILAIVLGWIGGHHFYAGYNRKGFLYLLFSFTFIPMLLALFQVISALLKTPDSNGKILV